MMNYIYFDKQRRDVCWLCGGRLVWDGDFDAQDYGYGSNGVVAHLHCSACNAQVTYVKLEEDE